MTSHCLSHAINYHYDLISTHFSLLLKRQPNLAMCTMAFNIIWSFLNVLILILNLQNIMQPFLDVLATCFRSCRCQNCNNFTSKYNAFVTLVVGRLLCLNSTFVLNGYSLGTISPSFIHRRLQTCKQSKHIIMISLGSFVLILVCCLNDNPTLQCAHWLVTLSGLFLTVLS